MDIEEVIKWLMIMKANLNSFPEVSNAKKIEALAEAIRLLKNEQSEEPSSSEKPNKSIEEKCPCYHCEYFEIKGWSHCKIHEDAYGDSRCNDYHKVSQDLTKAEVEPQESEKV